jgi:hypothetical protein
MFTDGDDASNCSNGLNARKFREATLEDRAIYRSWLRGVIFLYCGLLFIAGVAAVTYSGTGRTQLTGHQPVIAARGD